ncbi:biofilm development regulator YmgB/AriR family protein [Leclercia sp.]|uniref:biofilm development regulator YmgB/AriR family protein n=1 Tax=Leclercia sp. TaxID=1898428 RepID=UPI003FA57247
MTQHTQHFNALNDQALASYFRSSGNTLYEEAAVLGSAIRCILLGGDNLTNKQIILQLIYALELTSDQDAAEVIRNTLEIVVGFTHDDI